MQAFLAKIAFILISPSIFLTGAAGYHLLSNTEYQNISSPPVTQAFGSFSPTGGTTYRLYSSVGSADSTLILSSFKEPSSNIPYTMSYLGSDIEYATLSPISSISEFVSFSGIVQNADGTATLTGLIRGLARTPGSGGCVASSTLSNPHAGQSIFILSNPPCFQNEYGLKRNDQAWSGINTFTVPPILNDANATSSVQAASRLFVLNTAFNGAGTSSEVAMGISQLSTPTQLKNGTASSTSGAPLVVPNKYATSSCQVATTNLLISSSTTGKLDGPCFDTGYNYTHTGTNAFTASTTFSQRVSMSATTTIGASSVTNNALVLNGVAYQAPGAQGASGTSLQTDGTGILSWTSSGTRLANASTTITYTQPSSGVAYSLASTTVAGNTLGTNGLIHSKVFITNTETNEANTFTFTCNYGGQNIGSITYTGGGITNTYSGYFECYINTDNTTGIISGTAQLMLFRNIGTQSNTAVDYIQLTDNNTHTVAVDSTASQAFTVTWKDSGAGNAATTISTNYAVFDKIK